MNTPQPSPQPRLSVPRTVTGWLLTINIAVFVVDALLFYVFKLQYEVTVIPRVGPAQVTHFAPIEYWLHFSAYTAIQNLQVWRFIGFQFIHANLTHLVFNMFMLFMFGRFVEVAFGKRRYLAFYLLSGIAGPIAYCLLWASGWLVSTPLTPLVGASAGVFGVLIAVTLMAPDAEVLVFGLFPAKLKHVAFVLIFVAVYAVIFFGHAPTGNAGGEAAHLGGAAAGYLLYKHRQLLNVFDRTRPLGR